MQLKQREIDAERERERGLDAAGNTCAHKKHWVYRIFSEVFLATVTPAQTTSYNMEPRQQLHRHNNNTKLHTLVTHSYSIQNTLIIPSHSLCQFVDNCEMLHYVHD